MRLVSVPRLFLDLGGVEQRRDDRRRANADRAGGLYELGATLRVSFARLVILFCHKRQSMARPTRAARGQL